MMMIPFFLELQGLVGYGWECIYRNFLGGGGGYRHGKVIYISSHTDELEPIGTTIFLEEESLAVGEAARSAAGALGRVGAVEIGYVLVADVAEPGE